MNYAVTKNSKVSSTSVDKDEGLRVRSRSIDGLRAVAVLGVIAFHFKLGFAPAGFVGVDIFFVISGYVISWSLIQNSRVSTLEYILEFYKRRILRIFPALVCCLSIVGIFSVLFIPHSWLSESNNKTGLYAFAGLSNFALLSDQDGYFNDRAEFNPFLHTWSLAVEEQFYLFFPLIFLLWIKHSSGGGRRILVGKYVVPALGALSLAWAAFETVRKPELAFYMLPSRFWELAAGAELLRRHSIGSWLPRSVYTSRLVALLGILLLAVGMVWTDPTGFPFPWALVPVGGTIALICVARSVSAADLSITRILQNPVVVYLGKISYSLYLWHWPVVCLLRWTIGFATPVHVALACVLTLALGSASYFGIEKPFLRSSALRSLPAWRIVAVGGMLTICAAMSFRYVASESLLALSVVGKEAGWRASELPGHANAATRYSHGTSSALWVIGDSHAGAYRGMVQQAAVQQGMAVHVITLSGCAVANLLTPYEDTIFCRDYVQGIVDELARSASSGDVVFLASLRGQRLSNQWGEYDPDELQQRLYSAEAQKLRKEAFEQAETIVRRLSSLGFTIIMDTPKPLYRAPPFRCADWFNRMNPICAPGFSISADVLRANDAPVLASLRRLKAEFPSLVVWDPFPILCPGSACSAFRDGRPLFFDQDHLSGYGNLLLLPSFSELLQEIRDTNATVGSTP